MNATIRFRARALALSLSALLLVGLVSAGCTQKEEPAPKGTSYYTGPMESKGNAGGKQQLPKTE